MKNPGGLDDGPENAGGKAVARLENADGKFVGGKAALRFGFVVQRTRIHKEIYRGKFH